MNTLEVFSSPEFGKVRVVEQDNHPWYVLKDVCSAIGLKNATEASHKVRKKNITQYTSKDVSGLPNRGVNVINNTGLHTLVTKTKNNTASLFEKWITAKANHPEEAISLDFSNPDVIQMLLDKWKSTFYQLKQLQETVKTPPKTKVREDEKVLEQKMSQGKVLTILQVSKILNVPGMGRNNLFKFLREKGVFRKDNSPTEKYAQWFKVVTRAYPTHEGTVTKITPFVLEEGLNGIRELLKKDGRIEK